MEANPNPDSEITISDIENQLLEFLDQNERSSARRQPPPQLPENLIDLENNIYPLEVSCGGVLSKNIQVQPMQAPTPAAAFILVTEEAYTDVPKAELPFADILDAPPGDTQRVSTNLALLAMSKLQPKLENESINALQDELKGMVDGILKKELMGLRSENIYT